MMAMSLMIQKFYQMKLWTLMIKDYLMISKFLMIQKFFSITVVDFDDSKVFNDPKVISDVSVGFGNSKVRGDTIPLSSMVLYESEKVKL